jgi:diacylglycerol O-acyltransferase / wax synthase
MPAPKSQKLAAADIAWLRMDSPTNPMTIAGLMAFAAPMRLEQIRTLVEERLLIFERFRQTIRGASDSPTWVTDEHFDLGAHVHRIGLPAPGDKAALQELVGTLMSDRLDLSKPPWQMHLVEEFDGGAVLIVRLHHTLGDGIALINVLLSMADEHFAEFDRSRIPSYGRVPERRSLLESLTRPLGKTVTGLGRAAGSVLSGAFDLAQSPGKVFDLARTSLSVGAAASRIALYPTDSPTRFKGEVGVTKRVAWSGPFPVADVKAVGRAVDAKINDVLLAAVAGGLRRYFLAEGDPVEGVEFGTVIPVNLRAPEQAFELGNRFGIVFLYLPVGIPDARERLLEVQRRMGTIKSSAEPVVAYAILQAIGAGPSLLHREVVDLLSARFSSVTTNVPGPQEQIHILGVPVSHLMFWVPRAGEIGLGISVISYNGTVRVGVATDAKMAPDPGALVRGLHEEFEALKAEFAAEETPRAGRRKNR